LANSWVFSNLLPSSEQTGHNIYTVTSSKKLSGETWDISYGDGSGAKGVVYADKVVIGKFFFEGFALSNQILILPQEELQPLPKLLRLLPLFLPNSFRILIVMVSLDLPSAPSTLLNHLLPSLGSTMSKLL